MNLHRLISLAIFCAFFIPAAALAQDDEMSFDLDDIDDWEDEWEDDGDEMTFAPDDLDAPAFDSAAEATQILDVGVVVVPSPALNDIQRAEIQDALLEIVREIPNIVAYGDGDLLPALMDRDPEYCSRESLCLAGVGRNAGVQRIVQARVERSGSTYRLDLDYFDVRDRIFVAYHSKTGLSTVGALKEALQPAVNDIFNIRVRRQGDEFVDDAVVNIQKIMAFSTAGLAVAAAGTGVFFGNRVNTQKEELASFATDEEGRYESLTQVEAHEMQRQMQSDALAANLFYAVAGISGVTSITLFILNSKKGGQDRQAASEQEQPWYSTLQVSPKLDRHGVGFGARLTF